MEQPVIHIDTQVLSILIGIVIPLVTGIVTKLKSSSAVKAISTAVLSVVTGAVTTLASEPEKGIALYDFVFATFLAFVTAIATFYGFWKPSTIAGKMQSATADFGVGSDPDVIKK